ncbi:Hint domain-containing protein [Cognatishimia sp.]|uniref:Hint domain-containing protein n=1 Tax=Cognatishimia sp. TaxID=2211648 RepID=UPI0035165EC7
MATFTLQYVYQLSDFDTSGSNQAPPDESGAKAVGKPPFNLQLQDTAGPQQLEVSDTDDNAFDEINSGGQTLQSDITIDGTTYPAGSKVLVNYEITTDDGFSGFSITLGAENSGKNVTTAFVTTEPMEPGQLYSFTSEHNIGRGDRDYADFACFAQGTLIRTQDGETTVEDLREGQRVITENGSSAICKILSRTLSRRDLRRCPSMRPIRLVAGALGMGLPRNDLILSPQHKVLIPAGKRAVVAGVSDALVPAKKLQSLPGVFTDPAIKSVTYFHILLDAHEIIYANGAPTESLYLGSFGLSTFSELQRIELMSLFPEVSDPDFEWPEARPMLRPNQQRRLVARLAR